MQISTRSLTKLTSAFFLFQFCMSDPALALNSRSQADSTASAGSLNEAGLPPDAPISSKKSGLSPWAASAETPIDLDGNNIEHRDSLIDAKSEADAEKLYLHRPVSSDYSQLFSIEAAPFHPRSLAISNGDYEFNYGSNLQSSYEIEATWAMRLFRLFGTFSFSQGLAFAGASATSDTTVHGVEDSGQVSLMMMILDSRLVYSADWFPWRVIVPFVSGGYQYSLYYQSGRSDLESAEGGAGNIVGSAGARIWLNRGRIESGDYGHRFSTSALYLTLRTDWVMANNQAMDLGERTYFAGLALAL